MAADVEATWRLTGSMLANVEAGCRPDASRRGGRLHASSNRGVQMDVLVGPPTGGRGAEVGQTTDEGSVDRAAN